MNQENQTQEEVTSFEENLGETLQTKNRLLIKVRWVLALFAPAFFLLAAPFIEATPIKIIWPLFGLPLLVNLLLGLEIRRLERLAGQERENGLQRLMPLQLDVDLLFISSLLYFSGGFASPLNLLFILYVVLSTFLLPWRRALRNTLLAVFLVLVILLLPDSDPDALKNQLAALITFEALLIFTFLISAYLARGLHKSEQLMARTLEQTRLLSITDGLTGLYNQSHFFEMLDQESHKALRYNQHFSLIIFDVDNFKNFNDHNGHAMGSATLKRIGAIVKKRFRASDLKAKYGGDEFVIILPQTDKVGAYLAAERLRETVEQENFPGAATQPGGRLSLSLGIASLPEHGDNGEEILEKADKALYLSKGAGRNRTTIYSDLLAGVDD